METTTLDIICSNIKVWNDWQEAYGRNVPLFIAEASGGTNWKDWNPEVFQEYFMKSSGQCVSSLRQGYFTNYEKEQIKAHWDEIAPLLQKIALNQNEPLYDVYTELKVTIRKYTLNDRRAATNRLIGALQPQLLCTIVNEQKLWELVGLLRTHIADFTFDWKPTWFENSYQTLQLFKKALNNTDAYQIMTYPWQVYEEYDFTKDNNEKNNDMSEDENEAIVSLLQYKKQIILQGPPGTGKTRLAKEIAKKIIEDDNSNATNNEQCKIIQFHPSYNYEDFVRGIASKPNEDGEGVLYKAENRILATIAETALNNYLSSKGKQPLHSAFQNKLDRLLEDIRTKIEEGEGYMFGDKSTGKIIAIKEDGLLYHFPTREDIKYKVLFSDLEKIFNVSNQIEKPIDLRDLEKPLGLIMKGKYPYYYMLLKQLEAFKDDTQQTQKQELKNYVLIIDEINRANLSAVLGELIYALEYRGEAVESMYDVDGHTLTLPPNLYIIGTMNTADRSVGHIDYAIRRRFAFVEVGPQVLQDNDEIYFNTEGYNKVAALFNRTNVSSEFEPKDVQIGHSYFIAKKKEATDDTRKQEIFSMKMHYEVIPILNEYVKDGVLVGDMNGKSIKQYIEELKSAGL